MRDTDRERRETNKGREREEVETVKQAGRQRQTYRDRDTQTD